MTAPTRAVRILALTPEALTALADGDLARASASMALGLSDFLVEDASRGTWRRRVRQLAEDPTCLTWVTGVVVDAERGTVVGRAGYHGPPDAAGMVEIGYAIDPAHRRQGYARGVARELIARGVREPAVHVVRASIRPANVASLATIAGLGFTEVGEQWDDEDGLELLFEVRV